MLVQLYHTTLQMVLDKLYSLPTKTSLMLHGTFGIGKTEGMRKFAKRKAAEIGLEYSESFKHVNSEKHFCFLCLILHQYEPAEIKGLPFPNAERTQTIYLPVGLLPEKGQGMIFIDEINLASPMLQNNAYQLIEDRRIGFYEIPKDYIVCGAGNKDDDRGHTFEMAMPLNNRFVHAELCPPTVEDIELRLNPNLGDKSPILLIKGWINDYAIPNGIDHRIMNYLMYQRKDLFKYNPQENVTEPTIATPRMWKKVSDMIKNVPDSDEWLLTSLIGMGVGTGVATELVAWLKLSQKYDIAKLFKTGTFTKPTEVSVLYSLTSAIISYYAEKLQNKGSAIEEVAAQLLKLSCVFAKEHTAMVLNQVKNIDADFFKKIKKADPQGYTKMADDLFYLLI